MQTVVKLLEYKSNAWGQRVLDGVSWDFIWVSVLVGFAVIVCHAVFVARRNKSIDNLVDGKPAAELIDE